MTIPDFKIVETISDRNALANSGGTKAGMLVRVLQTEITYARNNTNTSWIDPASQFQVRNDRGVAGGYPFLDGDGLIPLAQVPSTAGANSGNPALLAQLNRATAVVNLYCDPSGNDVTGDGSFANPFRQVQRCLDEIPSGGRLGYPQGFVQVNAGPGNYKPFRLRYLNTVALYVQVIGDTQSPASAVLMLPTGVHPALVAAPSQVNAASYEYTFGGPIGFSTTEGSHWADTTFPMEEGGPELHFAETVDGVHTGGSKIRITAPYDLADGAVPVSFYAFTSTVDLTDTGIGVTISNDNPAGDFFNGLGTSLFVSGFRFKADFNLEFVGVNLYGCNIVGTVGQTNCIFRNLAHTNQSNVVQVDQVFYEDGNHTSIGGIHACNATIEGPTSETFLYGVSRGTLSGIAIFMGGPTAGRIGSSTDIEIEYFHLELGVIQIQGAATRWGNHAPVSIDGADGWFVARHGAKMKVQAVVGATTGIPCIFEAGCHCYSGLKERSTFVVNSGVGGNEVKIRSDEVDTGTIFTFAALPQTNTTLLTRVR